MYLAHVYSVSYNNGGEQRSFHRQDPCYPPTPFPRESQGMFRIPSLSMFQREFWRIPLNSCPHRQQVPKVDDVTDFGRLTLSIFIGHLMSSTSGVQS